MSKLSINIHKVLPMVPVQAKPQITPGRTDLWDGHSLHDQWHSEQWQEVEYPRVPIGNHREKKGALQIRLGERESGFILEGPGHCPYLATPCAGSGGQVRIQVNAHYAGPRRSQKGSWWEWHWQIGDIISETAVLGPGDLHAETYADWKRLALVIL